MKTGASPTLVGLEQLRAMLGAAEQVGLNREDVQRIFGDNATELLSLPSGNH